MADGRCTKLAEGGDWETVDACWFGERNSVNKHVELLLREAQAKRQCSLCPIRARCLAYALENEGNGRALGASESGKLEPTGIFGGLTGRERASVDHLPESERIPALERILAAQQPKFLLPEELAFAAP